VLRCQCWCPGQTVLCPVHGLGPFYQSIDHGIAAFPFSAGEALKTLRKMLTVLRVPSASSHRCHDLRRGHAQDLVESGAGLAELLAAGSTARGAPNEWRANHGQANGGPPPSLTTSTRIGWKRRRCYKHTSMRATTAQNQSKRPKSREAHSPRGFVHQAATRLSSQQKAASVQLQHTLSSQ
jgi:hypothetical protein